MSEFVFQCHHNKEVFRTKCPNCKKDVHFNLKHGEWQCENCYWVGKSPVPLR